MERDPDSGGLQKPKKLTGRFKNTKRREEQNIAGSGSPKGLRQACMHGPGFGLPENYGFKSSVSIRSRAMAPMVAAWPAMRSFRQTNILPVWQNLPLPFGHTIFPFRVFRNPPHVLSGLVRSSRSCYRGKAPGFPASTGSEAPVVGVRSLAKKTTAFPTCSPSTCTFNRLRWR